MQKIIKKTILLSSVLMVSLWVSGPCVFAGDRGVEKQRPGLSTVEIDQIVARAMDKFNVPGLAVGIIKDGKVIHAKGYGLRHVGKRGKVNEKTLFSIASTGKSFTAVALALLVDEGKIAWEDKVIDHLPDFRLYDPWVTREFTVKDLLIHNSGLGVGAGDLMLFPSQAFSRKEIISNLRHLKPVSSFRTKYAYDNLLYIVAGEVIASASGIPYEDFIDQHILKSLNMTHCTSRPEHMRGDENIAQPHIFKDGKVRAVESSIIFGQKAVYAAAGGILCSVESILKWHNMHLNKGKLPNGDIFLSKKQQEIIMTPQTITPVSPSSAQWFGTNFSAYGLGWRISDIYGVKMEHHAGGLLGMLSLNVMIPELNMGIAVYTNQQAQVARPAIIYKILDAYLTDVETDWTARFEKMMKQRTGAAMKAVPNLAAAPYTPSGKILRYVGIYKDPWLGNVEITSSRDGLYFKSERSEGLRGPMVPYKSDLFIVRWEDRTLNADAYVKFVTDYTGNPVGITMKAVSPLTDFSYDFHDLNFERVKEKP